jgi:hypothetical protein
MGQGQKKVPGPQKLIFDFSKGFLYRAMIKFEADPVVGYKQREARSDGERRTPRESIMWRRRAPKGPSCLVSSRRSDETQSKVRKTGHDATCSSSPSSALPTVSLPRLSACFHFPHTHDHFY